MLRVLTVQQICNNLLGYRLVGFFGVFFFVWGGVQNLLAMTKISGVQISKIKIDLE